MVDLRQVTIQYIRIAQSHYGGELIEAGMDLSDSLFSHELQIRTREFLESHRYSLHAEKNILNTLIVSSRDLHYN